MFRRLQVHFRYSQSRFLAEQQCLVCDDPSHNQQALKLILTPIFSFFVFMLGYSISCYGCVFAFVVLDVVFLYQTKRLAGKNVSEMIYRVGQKRTVFEN